MKILTWHVHGSYLLYLTRFSGHEFYLPVDANGTGGRGNVFPFGDNVKDVPAEDVMRTRFDCILFQTKKNWTEDQHRILSAEQRRLPRIYLEHDPPLEHPSEQIHPIASEADVLLVHVTPFNALAWNNGGAATRVIEHGVFLTTEHRATYELEKGITAINNIATRGRRAGGDIFSAVRARGIPVDLVGMEAEAAGGLGEVSPPQLPEFLSHYRFYFNPSRYTSLNLAVIEAMMVGLPVVGLATTEMATVIQNGSTGFIDTDVERLIAPMRELVNDRNFARTLGLTARHQALERFNIVRFTEDWNAAFSFVTGSSRLSAIAK
jgi:hypothetical protein